MATAWKDIQHKFSDERLAELKREAAVELERLGFSSQIKQISDLLRQSR